MDELDKKILEMLKKDSRSTNAVMGKSVGLSEGAVRKRVQSLHKSGIISKFTVDVRGVGAAVRAIVFAVVSQGMPNQQICKKITALHGVDSVWEITGDHDICVVLSSSTMDELNAEIDSIRNLAGVASTETYIITKNWL